MRRISSNSTTPKHRQAASRSHLIGGSLTSLSPWSQEPNALTFHQAARLRAKSTWEGSFDENSLYVALSHSTNHNTVDEHFHLLEMFSAAMEQGFIDPAVFDRVLEKVTVEKLAKIGIDKKTLEAMARSSIDRPTPKNTMSH